MSQYYNIALQQFGAARQVLSALFPAAQGDLDVLDFACGYGRLLRFLTRVQPQMRICGAELQSQALDFVAAEFGVETLPSHANPQKFGGTRRFDVIWVASLFTHLPADLFRTWLDRLYGLLSERGVLCFSVRDEVLLPEELPLPANGILYQPVSENPELDARIYGTTYANETYVAQILHAIAGHRNYLRLPRALANEQDLYVWPRDAQRNLSGLNGFRRGVWGWVDRRELGPAGYIYLEGWAGSLDDGPAAYVEIVAGGESHRVQPDIARADVVAAFAAGGLERCGWAWRSRLPAAPGVWIEVVAHGRNGATGLLYAGNLARGPAQTHD